MGSAKAYELYADVIAINVYWFCYGAIDGRGINVVNPFRVAPVSSDTGDLII
jgi:hypothetical protein